MLEMTRAAVLALCAFVAAQAVSAEETSSDTYAAQAIKALYEGRRDRAIVLALKGLPADPTDEDFEIYSAAHDALFRAVTARIIHTDRSGFHHFGVNATGTRVVAGPANGPQGGSGDAPPYTLYEALIGTEIADLVSWNVPMSMTYGPGRSPAFSADGSRVAIWAMDEGKAMIFDTVNGAALTELEAGGVPGSIIGFSPDGSRIAAVSGKAIVVWDLASGTRVAGAWPDTLDGPGGARWAADGSLVVATSETENYEISAVTLTRYTERGADGSVRTEISGPAINILTSPTGTEVLLLVGETQLLVDPVAGTVVALGSPGDSFWQFVRAGKAVATMRKAGWGPFSGGYKLTVKSLDGSDLAPHRRDWVVFDQFIADLNGNILGLGEVGLYTWRAEEIPEGRALFDAVVAVLPKPIKDEIEAGRISR